MTGAPVPEPPQAVAGSTRLLDFLATATAARVAVTARRVGAIRMGARHPLSATIWGPNLALTCERSLPDQDHYLLLLDHGHAIAHLLWRDRDTGLAVLRLDTKLALAEPLRRMAATPGALLVIAGVDEAGQTAAALAVLENRDESEPLGLDRPLGRGDAGAALIAACGALVGIVAAASAGHARVIPHDAIAHMLTLQPTELPPSHSLPAREKPAKTDTRGWLGAELQPVAVPIELRQLARQNSGRLVIQITSPGPAERAGLAPGDIVLCIAEQSMVGYGAVRGFLAKRIGQTLEMLLLREGQLVGLDIVVGERPVH